MSFHITAQSQYLLFYRATQWYGRIRTAHTYIVMTICQASTLPIFTHLMFPPYNPPRWIPSLSLASKENKAWSKGVPVPPHSGCNLKEAGVREKSNEARKWGESIWRCVIKLVATKYDRFLLLVLPWDHPAKSCVTCISDSHTGTAHQFLSALWDFLSAHSSESAPVTPQCQQESHRVSDERQAWRLEARHSAVCLHTVMKSITAHVYLVWQQWLEYTRGSIIALALRREHRDEVPNHSAS